MIVVRWKKHLLSGGWQIEDPAGPLEYLFSRWRLRQTPRNVRDPSLHGSLEQLVRDSHLSEWWHEACGAAGHKLFLLKFRDGAWDIPWEWLVGELRIPENRKNVSLVRTLEEQTPLFEPSRFGRPLRILILQGEDGTSIGAKIDLGAEANAIIDAWTSLEHAVQKRVLRPRVASAELSGLASLLADEPDVVWFTGHGRHKPKPGLLLADGHWADPNEIGSLLVQSAWKPRFWFLMACDTARGGRTLEDLPAFVTQFFKVGTLSVLGMQSPVGDVSARVLARELFGGLALGLSLELALARARAVLNSTITESRNRMDWASPVIWTSTRLVERWEWDTADNEMVRLQSLGREILRAGRINPSQLDPPSSDDELTIARAWVANSRTWIASDGSSPETRARWLRILKAVQQGEPRYVVEIDPGNTEIELFLRTWAEAAYGSLLPGYAPEEFARALFLLKSQPIAGWNALLKVKGLLLAIANPPQFDLHGWFWRPLLETEDLNLVVLSSSPQPESTIGLWAVDKIENTMNMAPIVAAVARAPRLARALALLREPIGYSLLQLDAAESNEPRSLDEWSGWNAALVEVPGGPLMSATARQVVLSSTTAEQMKTAHIDCGRILSNPDIPLTLRVREETLFHAVQANDWEPALIEAEALCNWYRELDRPAAVVGIVRRLGQHSKELSGRVALRVAWAYAQLGDATTSDFWLRRARPSGPVEEAWVQGLRAELRKSAGDREGAATAIDQAIRICEDALRASPSDRRDIQRRLRNYRQDRARIRHFLFYDLDGADKAYQELIKDWNDEPTAQLDLAIVLRNHAECLRTLATGPNDPRMLLARDELTRSEVIAKQSPDNPLLSEVLYEQAKMAETLGQDASARDFLSKSIDAAHHSGHYQIEAIAQARLFWAEEPFSIARWREIDTNLAAHPDHGWPVRTLLNGRLRAARLLETQGQPQTALDILDSARAVVARNRWLDGRSDRFRICAIAAGQEVVMARLGQSTTAWADFRTAYSWSQEYLASQGVESAEQIWAKVPQPGR
jgi:tetratricopeptide (TPR) repeat protein